MSKLLIAPVALICLSFWIAAAGDRATAPRTAGSAAVGGPHTAATHASLERGDPEDCFLCHDDNTLAMARNGREISLYIDPKAYEASPHNQLDCVRCHVGFDPDEEPHKDNIQPVDCTSCHAEAAQAFQQSKHRPELTCTSCHEDVHAPRVRAAYVQTCQRCHDEAAGQIRESAHGASKAGPGCLGCHTPHAVEAVNSALCLSCHGEKEFVHEFVTHEDLASVLQYRESIHGEVIECSDCHTGHRILPDSNAASTVARPNIAATCAQCHDDIAEKYLTSEHGKDLQAGLESAPTCTDCHGEHDIHQITDSASRVSRQHEIEVCLKCHLDAPEVRQGMSHTSAFITSYAESIHGRAAAAGNLEAAICSDCHGAHESMKASDPASRVNKFNLSGTCGRCHRDIESAFTQSIHGTALAQGIADAPTCTGCHDEHAIIEPSRTESPVAAQNVSEQVCRPCHASVKLSEKYGFPSDRLATFGNSFHGLAGRFGSQEVANCASCHGVHDILPSSDPRSKVNKSNLDATCGQCHPGATANFAVGNVHIIRTPEGDRLLYWISSIYLILIITIVGAMAAHNALDWGRKLKETYRERLVPPVQDVVERKTGLYVRMTVNERIQHALLASSFIILVLTGFMLKFPDAWWVRGLRDVFGQALLDLRGLTHRVAAVIMVGTACYHLYYLFFVARGRQFIRDIMVRRSDLSDMIQVLRYNLGLDRHKPRFARFNYIEKSEYWALIWGTVIMTVTGIVLWFENQFMGMYSKLFVDVNETIHYFEAWLAFLSILVWHIYYVIFNPDVYPMNFTWLTGTMTEEEMEKEHPLELEKLKEGESIEA